MLEITWKNQQKYFGALPHQLREAIPPGKQLTITAECVATELCWNTRHWRSMKCPIGEHCWNDSVKREDDNLTESHRWGLVSQEFKFPWEQISNLNEFLLKKMTFRCFQECVWEWKRKTKLSVKCRGLSAPATWLSAVSFISLLKFCVSGENGSAGPIMPLQLISIDCLYRASSLKEFRLHGVYFRTFYQKKIKFDLNSTEII